MMLDAKKISDILKEYETDLFNEHITNVMGNFPDKNTTITAAKVVAIREIRNRLGIPEIKA